jgi:hypothetical protein
VAAAAQTSSFGYIFNRTQPIITYRRKKRFDFFPYDGPIDNIFSLLLYCSSLVYSTHFSIGSLSFCVYRRRPYWNIEWRFLVGCWCWGEVEWVSLSTLDRKWRRCWKSRADGWWSRPSNRLSHILFFLGGANIIDSWEMHLNIRKKSPDSLKTRRNVIRLRCWKRTQKLPGCCVWLLLPLGIGKLIDK